MVKNALPLLFSLILLEKATFAYIQETLVSFEEDVVKDW